MRRAAVIGVGRGVLCGCAVGIVEGRVCVGCVSCRCAVGIGERRVVLVVCGVAVPSGLLGMSYPMRCAIVIGVERICVGCVWCCCAVGIGGGRVCLGVSGVAVTLARSTWFG